MPRTKKCPTCNGAKKIRQGAVYPGTGAYRPEVVCPTCMGAGKVPLKPAPPKHKLFRIRLEVTIPADGVNHADALGKEFVTEALSAMQWGGSLPAGYTAQIVRDPARQVESFEAEG